MSGIVEPLPVAVYTADAQVGKAAQHEEMLRRTEFLESLIADLPEQPKGGPGHNRQPITQDDVHEIAQAIAVLKAQPVVPTAPDDVRAAQSVLQKIAGRLGTYLDNFFLEAFKSAGKEFGKQLARAPYWLALWYALQRLDQALTGWLH
jgi:hypothetical protein